MDHPEKPGEHIPLKSVLNMVYSQEAALPVVSKGEYVLSQSKRGGLRLVGTGFWLCACVLFVLVVHTAKMAFEDYSAAQSTTQEIQFTSFTGETRSETREVASLHSLPTGWLDSNVSGFFGFAVALLFCSAGGFLCFKRADEIQVGVPFTRVNTAGLPATESLVRASLAPSRERSDLLLRSSDGSIPAEQLVRPAAYSEDKQPEQLVRSAARPE